jgi:hypothetical protein
MIGRTFESQATALTKQEPPLPLLDLPLLELLPELRLALQFSIMESTIFTHTSSNIILLFIIESGHGNHGV